MDIQIHNLGDMVWYVFTDKKLYYDNTTVGTPTLFFQTRTEAKEYLVSYTGDPRKNINFTKVEKGYYIYRSDFKTSQSVMDYNIVRSDVIRSSNLRITVSSMIGTELRLQNKTTSGGTIW